MIRLGINPIGWTNDDVRWLGDDIPLEVCLAQARQAGYVGIELGRKFPRQAKKLKKVLDRHDLALVSGWYSARLLERSAKDEIAAMQDHLEPAEGARLHGHGVRRDDRRHRAVRLETALRAAADHVGRAVEGARPPHDRGRRLPARPGRAPRASSPHGHARADGRGRRQAVRPLRPVGRSAGRHRPSHLCRRRSREDDPQTCQAGRAMSTARTSAAARSCRRSSATSASPRPSSAASSPPPATASSTSPP